MVATATKGLAVVISTIRSVTRNFIHFPTTSVGGFWSDLSGHTWEYRSHFGSRYKLGCCGHASLLAAVQIPRSLSLRNDFSLDLKFLDLA